MRQNEAGTLTYEREQTQTDRSRPALVAIETVAMEEDRDERGRMLLSAEIVNVVKDRFVSFSVANFH